MGLQGPAEGGPASVSLLRGLNPLDYPIFVCNSPHTTFPVHTFTFSFTLPLLKKLSLSYYKALSD